MKISLNRTKYSVLTLIFTAVGAFAAILPLPLWVGVFFGCAYLIGNGWLLGKKTFPSEPLGWRILLGALGLWAALLVMGSVAYYTHSLNAPMVFLVLSLVPALIATIPSSNRGPDLRFAAMPDQSTKEAESRPSLVRTGLNVIVLTVILALTSYAWGLLSAVATEETMRSPWDVVPRAFFIILFLIALLTASAAYGKLTSAGLIGIGALVVLCASVAASVYSIGFGFDPFIHRATEQVIFAHGTIAPKPFYYVGQYTAVILAARVLGGHVAAIDLHLVAVALAFLVPLVYWSMRRGFGWKGRTAGIASFGLLALPLSSFATTTPQGLANVMLLAIAFLSVAYMTGALPAWYLGLLGIASVAIHPLAGVPAMIYIVILLFVRASERLTAGKGTARFLLLAKLVILGSIALPAMFVLNSMLSGSAGVEVDTESLKEPFSLLKALVGTDVATRHFSPTLDFAYAWKAVRTAVLAGFGLTGIWLMRKKEQRAAMALGAGGLAFFINYVLLKTVVDFPFLIAYERSNYADRLIDLTLFLLAPAAFYALGRFLMRTRRVGFPGLGIGVVILLSAVAVSSIYLAYPRRDRYESSRGWSTGAHDIRAVTEIEERATDMPYIVLANQSVSAAAIDRLGFKRYFTSRDPERPDPVFFYPVPTGGPLYSIFLDMNDTFGDRKTAERAMDLVNVDAVYYVVNHYWWQAQRIVSNARKDADAWWSIEDRIWVFEYLR